MTYTDEDAEADNEDVHSRIDNLERKLQVALKILNHKGVLKKRDIREVNA